METGNNLNFTVKNAAKTIPIKKLFQTGEIEITVVADNHYIRIGDILSDYPSALPAPLAANASVTSTTTATTDSENIVTYGATSIEAGVGVGDFLRIDSGADAELGFVKVVKVETGKLTVKKLTNFTSTAGDKIIKFYSKKITSAAKTKISLKDLVGQDGNLTIISDNATPSAPNIVIEHIPPVTPKA